MGKGHPQQCGPMQLHALQRRGAVVCVTPHHTSRWVRFSGSCSMHYASFLLLVKEAISVCIPSLLLPPTSSLLTKSPEPVENDPASHMSHVEEPDGKENKVLHSYQQVCPPLSIMSSKVNRRSPSLQRARYCFDSYQQVSPSLSIISSNDYRNSHPNMTRHSKNCSVWLGGNDRLED